MRKTGIFFLLFVLMITAAACAAGKPESGKKQENKLNETMKKTGDILGNKKNVFLYFYSSTVKDSRKHIDTVKSVAAAAGAEVVEIEAYDVPELRDAYSIDYVPTVILIRRDAGMAAKWIVDIPRKELEAAAGKTFKPLPEQEKIGDGIKKEKPQLLFFMADWCGYCQKVIPQVQRFASDFSDRVNVVTVNIDKAGQAADIYAINGVPVILIVDKNGLAVKRTGFPDGYQEYKKYFSDLGVDFTKKPAEKEEPSKSSAPSPATEKTALRKN